MMPAAGLEDRIEPGPRGIRAASAVAGDRQPHEIRPQPEQADVVESQPVECAHAHVVDQHVARLDERAHRIDALSRLQIEHERSLAAVPADEAVLNEAKRIAARRLDLPHLSAQIGQQSRAERAGEEAGQVDDADAGERTVEG